jgi:hypothetical protein
MRFLHTAFWLAIGISPAFAQRAPVIVIPGRPDVPVLAPPHWHDKGLLGHGDGGPHIPEHDRR